MHVTLTATELATHDAVATAAECLLGVTSALLGWDLRQQEEPIGAVMVLLGLLLVVGALT